ncbi:hypothetical protein ACFPRL_32095 [Pseudoclavibacter helvolus]
MEATRLAAYLQLHVPIRTDRVAHPVAARLVRHHRLTQARLARRAHWKRLDERGPDLLRVAAILYEPLRGCGDVEGHLTHARASHASSPPSTSTASRSTPRGLPRCPRWLSRGC